MVEGLHSPSNSDHTRAPPTCLEVDLGGPFSGGLGLPLTADSSINDDGRPMENNEQHYQRMEEVLDAMEW